MFFTTKAKSTEWIMYFSDNFNTWTDGQGGQSFMRAHWGDNVALMWESDIGTQRAYYANNKGYHSDKVIQMLVSYKPPSSGNISYTDTIDDYGISWYYRI